MSLSREVIGRAMRRVGLSSAGEVVGRAVNLLLPFALLTIYNAGTFTDSFFLAMAVAFFVQGTLANVLVNTLVAELVNHEKTHDLRVFLGWTSFAGLFAGLVASTLTAEQLSFNATFITAISVAFMASAGLAAAPAIAKLNVAHRYGMPGLTWGLRIIPLGLYFFWRPEEPVLHWLLAGLALADIMRAVILMNLTKAQFCLHHSADTLHFPLSAKHMIFASSIAGLTPLIVRWIASFGNAGDVSIFEAADRLYAAVASLATIGIGNVTLVYLANLTNTPEEQSGWKLILRTSIAWSLLWLALSILLWFSFPFVMAWIKFQTYNVSAEIRHTFLALSLGIPGFIMTGVFSRRLLTLGYSHALIPMALIGLICTTLISGLLFNLLATVGIGLSLSASQYLVMIMMSRKLAKISAHANTNPI